MGFQENNQKFFFSKHWVLIAGVILGVFVVVGIIFLLANQNQFAGGDLVTNIVNEDEVTDIKLKNDAELIIPAGAIPDGTSVTFQSIPEKSWPDLSEAGIGVKGIFQIEAASWAPSMESELIIPFDSDKFTQDEIDNAYLAYFNNGYWVEIPSTIDVESGEITATLNHFSSLCFCIRPFWNKKPTVEIYTTPGAVIASENENLDRDFQGDNVEIDIYTNDPDGDPVYLYYELSLHTLAGAADTTVEQFNEKAKEATIMALRAGSLLEAATVADLDDVGEVAVSEVWNSVWESLPVDANREPSLQYLPPYNPGEHKITIDIDLLADGLSGIYDETTQITDLYVTFYAFDSFDYSPREEIVRIPFVLGTAPEFGVLNPPVGSQVICPSTPRFSWIYNDSSANSVGIWLQKGERIKGKIDLHDREYSTSTHKLITEYTPELDDGRYSLLIGVSREGDDKEFTNPGISTRSNIYHFTVDSTLVSNDGKCSSIPATPSDRQINQVEDGIDGGVVPQSNLPGVEEQLANDSNYDATTTGLIVTNDSDKDMCVVNIKSLLESNTGKNQLDDIGKLRKGDKQFFPLPPGSYDVILKDCNDTILYNHNGSVDVELGETETLQFSSSVITLQIENHSIEPICELDVFVKRSNKPYRLGFSSPIEPSGGLQLTLPEGPGQFDIRLKDCEGASLVEESSVYVANHYIIRALPMDGDIAPRIERDTTSTTIYIKETLVQSMINQQFREIFSEMKDYVEFKSSPEAIFEDGAVLVRGEISIQGAPTATGYFEVNLYVSSAGAVQVGDVNITVGGVNIPISSFQEAKTLINEAFQEIFATIFVERGIRELSIDNGVMIVRMLPVCANSNSESGNCIPLDLYNEFLSGIELLAGKPANVIDTSSCTEVPDVTGLLSSDASRQLSKLGFKVRRFRSDADSIVTSQQPREGTCHLNPQLVTVSLQEIPINKPGCVVIPDFFGKSYNIVEDWSKEKGFNFTRGNESYQPDKQTGIVLRQNPPAGYCAHPNDAYMYVWVNSKGGQ